MFKLESADPEAMLFQSGYAYANASFPGNPQTKTAIEN